MPIIIQPEKKLAKTVEEMSVAEYDAAIEKFIQEAAEWDGALPLATFFEAWAALEQLRTDLDSSDKTIEA